MLTHFQAAWVKSGAWQALALVPGDLRPWKRVACVASLVCVEALQAFACECPGRRHTLPRGERRTETRLPESHFLICEMRKAEPFSQSE